MALAEPLVYTARAALLNKKDLASLVSRLAGKCQVFGPTRKDGEIALSPVRNLEDLELDYVTTLLPPKKYFYAPFDTIFSFHREGGVIHEENLEERRVLFGLHPCDVNALLLLDRVFTGQYEDDRYKRKRENTLIVGLNCNKPGENCFCSSFGTGPDLRRGYDLLLTNLGDRYLLEAGSGAGEELLHELRLKKAEPQAFLAKENVVRLAKGAIKKKINTDNLPKILNQNFGHGKWAELKEECLACGACTIVCPTCYCFNVFDKLDLTLKHGERQIVWDSCVLLEFGEVAMGGNFRRTRAARIKQRIYHKLSYFETQYGTLGCVGCGRCVTACIKKIDPTAIVNAIRGD